MSKVITLPLGFANAFIIRGRGTIMVDTGIHVRKEKYLQLFAAHGIEPHSIQLLIITHAHADHFAQAGVVKELTGAPLVCHKEAARFLRMGDNAPAVPCNELGRKALQALGRKLPLPAKPVNPDIIIDSDFDLGTYGIAGRIIVTPGHTDCSLSVIIDDGQAIVGDMVVPDFFTRKPSLAYFATDAQALAASVTKLLSLAHTFFSSHGGPFSKEVVLQLCTASGHDCTPESQPAHCQR